MKQGQEGVSQIYASIPNVISSISSRSKVGEVIGVVMGENLPTSASYERAGGLNGVGAILYQLVDSSTPSIVPLSSDESVNSDDSLFDRCEIAYPFFSQVNNYPLVGEKVYIIEDFPSANATIENTSVKKYYISVINIWNNPQHNSINSNNLGRTFKQSPNIQNLLNFEGDYIIQGRKGNSIRFSSTTRFKNQNEWSSVGSEGDPITIISNGHNYKPNSLYVEKINEEKSSVYLTTSQQIPLITDKHGILNPLTKPIEVNKYNKSQVIINADRIVINSKKDEVMLFATSNIELNTKNVINLNSDERIHFNSPRVFIGTNKDGTLPTEPLVLGNQTVSLLSDLFKNLSEFSGKLSSAISTPQGSPLTDVNIAATELSSNLKPLFDKLKRIISNQNYTN